MLRLRNVLFVVFVSCLLLSAHVWAVELSVAPTYNLYEGGEMEAAFGLKATLGNERFYAFASGEELLRRYGGQECVDITLLGIGIGAQRELVEDLLVSFDFGWFIPDSATRPPFDYDGAWYAFSNTLGISIGDPRYHFWEHYSHDIKSNLGASIGISFRRPISKRFNLSIGIRYRYLKLSEAVYGWDGEYDGDAPHWEIFPNTNFSGAQLTVISFSYDFR